MRRCSPDYKTLASFRSSGQISSRSLSPFQTLRTLSVKVLMPRFGGQCCGVGSMQIIRKISSYGKCKQQDISIISASGLWRGLWRKDPPMELQLLIQLLPGECHYQHHPLHSVPAILVHWMRCHDQPLQQRAVVPRALWPTTQWLLLIHKTESNPIDSALTVVAPSDTALLQFLAAGPWGPSNQAQLLQEATLAR